MTYAIIKVAGKQYRVREGERLLVDRLRQDEGSTFAPTVLLVGGDGAAQLEPGEGVVTAKVLGDTKGPKIRIGKYKKRTGYRRHTGFRASLTQIQIESIGSAAKSSRTRAKAKEEPEAKAAATPEVKPAAEETDERVKGMPAGYEDLTVAQIKEAASGWNRPMLEAALEYEHAHAARKGAVAAIESALADKEGDG
ncbi:MAG TPA: 50S ribosomal protein L21 [Gaiellaceae bacterium]|jgi:large subunit ribosomal protein L21|nr:50S ribosomal protein L21 [Gaiellaceae bacterium]